MRTLLTGLVAIAILVATFLLWMNSGGGASVELSDEELAQARESGEGARAIEVEAEREEEPLPTMEELKLVTSRAQLDVWADRTRAALAEAEGDDRLLVTVLLAEIERLRGNVAEARELGTLGASGLPSNSRARQVNAATILAEIVEEAGDGGVGAILGSLTKVKSYKAELKAAIELDPANVDARVAQIIVFAYAPFPVGSKKAAKGLIEELGAYDEFRRDFWRAMLISTGDDNVDEGLIAFRALEERKPEDLDVLYTIGDLLGRADRWREAAEVFGRLVELAPESRQGFNALYQAAKAREKVEFELEEALGMLQRFEAADPVGELMPSMDRVIYHQGKVLEKMGRPADARLAYRRADALEPGVKRVQEGLRRVEAELATDAPEESEGAEG